jgi:hypothetical protein
MSTRTTLLSGLALALLGLGCSKDHHDDDPGPTPPPQPILSGVLTDSPIQGVAYATNTNVAGTTDAAGTFTYHAADTVQFKLGPLALGSLTAKPLVTPFDLAAGSANKLQNLLVLFQSLDADRNDANGIAIPAAAAAAMPATLDLAQAPATFASPANTGLQTAMTAGGITAPIVTTAQANANFQQQGLVLLSANTWGFADSSRAVFLRIAPNGEYYMASVGPSGGGAQAGLEHGTFTISGYDAKGYFGKGAATLDTNGSGGLSHNNLTCDRFTVGADAIASSSACNTETSTTPKLDNNAATIVGAWAIGSATTLKTHTVVFYANGRVLFMDPQGASASCGSPGIEFGSYTWNASTGALSFSNFIYDTNGCGGLYDVGTPNPPARSAVLSADGKTLTFTGDGTSTGYRVSK